MIPRSALSRRWSLLALSALLAPAWGASAADYADFVADGAWCWFSDPRAVYAQGRIFAGWIAADGSVQIGARDVSSGATRITTLAEKFEADDHDNPALLILPDGRLAAFYSRHASSDMHFRATARPGDIGEWTPDRMLGFQGGGRRGVTYANPVMLAAENDAIYVFWRGSDFKPTFSVSKDLGRSWSAPRALLQRPGADDTNRPYLKVWSDGDGRIDFVFTDGHPRNEANNSVYFLRYEKGAFLKADGTRIGGFGDLPLDPARCDRVYDGSTAGRAWIWDVAEHDGHPVVAYTRLPAEGDHRYHYARWDGARWVDVELVAAGGWFPQTPRGRTEPEPHYSGGMALDPGHVGTVYLSRPVAGVFEIERWRTPDGGQTWRSEAVTSASKASNVRPVVVRRVPPGEPDLLWMNLGGRYVHYTDFRTSVKINDARPPRRPGSGGGDGDPARLPDGRGAGRRPLHARFRGFRRALSAVEHDRVVGRAGEIGGARSVGNADAEAVGGKELDNGEDRAGLTRLRRDHDIEGGRGDRRVEPVGDGAAPVLGGLGAKRDPRIDDVGGAVGGEIECAVDSGRIRGAPVAHDRRGPGRRRPGIGAGSEEGEAHD